MRRPGRLVAEPVGPDVRLIPGPSGEHLLLGYPNSDTATIPGFAQPAGWCVGLSEQGHQPVDPQQPDQPIPESTEVRPSPESVEPADDQDLMDSLSALAGLSTARLGLEDLLT